MDEKKEILFEIIRNLLEIPDITLDENMLLIEHLGFDSVQMIRLIVEIEDAFGITFQGSGLLFERLDLIADLWSMVEEMILAK